MSDDDRIEREVQAITLRYLERATPAQWHVYAARSNYDSNRFALQWLAENPQLTRATALLMYWALGAGWHVQFASEADVDSWALPAHRLIRSIEARFLAGFYAEGSIYFDPEDGPVPPGDYVGMVQNTRPVPDAMLAIVPGSDWVDLDDEAYDDGLPMDVLEQIEALFES
jgi:hypothetical protein